MKKFFSYLRSDKFVYWGCIGSIMFILLSLLLVAILFPFLPPFVPVYNKLAWGYARLGTQFELFIPIGIAIIIIVGNNIFGQFAYTRVPLLARMLSGITLLASATLLIYIVQILLLVH